MRKLTSLFITVSIGLLIDRSASFAQSTPTCVSTYTLSWIGEDNMEQFGANAFTIIVAGGTSLSDSGITAASDQLSGYLSRITVPPITLIPGGVYPTAVMQGFDGYYPGYFPQEVQVWIDFNDNGSFDTSEEVSPVSGYGSPSPVPITFNITIPPAANPGRHLMRMLLFMKISTVQAELEFFLHILILAFPSMVALLLTILVAQ